MSENLDLKCCNPHCFKSHCARHPMNHENPDALNLNPYDEFKCKYYLPKYKAVRTRSMVQIEGFNDRYKNDKKK